jgi:hypothetical protein
VSRRRPFGPGVPEQGSQSLANLRNSTPWLVFGGIPAPFLGIFSATGSTAAVIDPDGPSLAQSFPLLPANLKRPVPATNEAQFGFGVDTETSPSTPSAPRWGVRASWIPPRCSPGSPASPTAG